MDDNAIAIAIEFSKWEKVMIDICQYLIEE